MCDESGFSVLCQKLVQAFPAQTSQKHELASGDLDLKWKWTVEAFKCLPLHFYIAGRPPDSRSHVDSSSRGSAKILELSEAAPQTTQNS